MESLHIAILILLNLSPALMQSNPGALGVIDVDNRSDSEKGGIWSRLKRSSKGIPLDTQTMNHVLVTEPDEAFRKKVRQEVLECRMRDLINRLGDFILLLRHPNWSLNYPILNIFLNLLPPPGVPRRA